MGLCYFVCSDRIVKSQDRLFDLCTAGARPQWEIARQLDGPLAKLFDFLLLLMKSLLSLRSQFFRLLQLFGKSPILQLEFSVLFGEPFGPGSLRVPTPK